MNKPIIIEEISKAKLTQPIIKQIYASILAGILIGIAYTATYLVIVNTGANNETISMLYSWLGSVIFGIGLLSCFMLGANLFTGNCVGFVCCLHKKIKWKWLFINLFITFFGNYIGSIIAAILIFLLPVFSSSDGEWFKINQVTINFINLISKKINMPFWQVLIGGIFCNILVIGSLIAWIIFQNKIASIIIILLLIGLFTLTGYQHIVANMFSTTLAWLLTTLPNPDHLEFVKWTTSVYGKLFYSCFLFTTIGNFIGGIFLLWIYLAINVHSSKKTKIDPPSTSK